MPRLKSKQAALQDVRIPRHIAIIMDGNGRWATRRGLPRVAGHRAGVEALRDIVRACSDWGVEVLTVFAFSTENWKRPKDEVDALMHLLVEYIEKELDELHANQVRIRPIGILDEVPEFARREILRAEELTRDNHGLVFNLALNYGGRREIIEATKQIARLAREGKLDPEAIDEELVSSFMFTGGLPDPDLLIRPSGEMRVSNFLLWQLAYTEFWVTDVLWPDFRREHLWQAIVDYQQRDRRFGGLGGC